MSLVNAERNEVVLHCGAVRRIPIVRDPERRTVRRVQRKELYILRQFDFRRNDETKRLRFG